MIKLFVFLNLFLCTQFVTAADDTGVSYTIHHQYVSTRALGMGDAFVAVADDYNALFYNPAGLSRRTERELNLSLGVGATAQLTTFQKSISDAQGTPGTDTDKQNAMIQVLQEQYGKSYSLRVQGPSAVYVSKNFGIGFIPLDLSFEGTLHQQVGPAINATVYVDSTLAMGYGHEWDTMMPGRLSWGVTGKFINREYFSKSINFVELASDSKLVQNSDLREGYGLDADLGLLYTPAISHTSLLRYSRPTFGFVVRNALQSSLSSTFHLVNKNTSLPPEPLYRVFDLGSKWEIPSFWIFSGRGVVDIRDINHPLFTFKKGLHLGAEFDWRLFSWWKGAYRLGVNQGYYTAGISALIGIFNLDFATYGEEVGPYSTPVQNRMYSLKLSLNF